MSSGQSHGQSHRRSRSHSHSHAMMDVNWLHSSAAAIRAVERQRSEQQTPERSNYYTELEHEGLLLEKQMKLHLLTTQRLRQLVETALRKHLTTFALANMHFMTADNHPYVGSQRVTEAITQHILHLIHSYHEYHNSPVFVRRDNESVNHYFARILTELNDKLPDFQCVEIAELHREAADVAERRHLGPDYDMAYRSIRITENSGTSDSSNNNGNSNGESNNNNNNNNGRSSNNNSSNNDTIIIDQPGNNDEDILS